MDKKITVITPTYNRAHTLDRVYQSLVNQSFKDFIWLVMDDGSTDHTKDLIQKFKEENQIEIEYHWQENQAKFHTVFDGVKKVKSPYFVIWDSDDAFPEDSLEILYGNVVQLPKDEKFMTVTALSAKEDGSIVGDKFPYDIFDGSVLEMRYKYKVKGDKNGIFITEPYLQVLDLLDLNQFEKGVYIPYSVFYNLYDSLGYKTRFINKVVRYYLFDEADGASVSSTRTHGKNRYGLMVGYLSFVNDYGIKLMKYPKALIRNLIGYQTYAFSSGRNSRQVLNDLKRFKPLGILLLPLSYLYNKFKF
ncbi:MAG: glycosyltransferase family 2 protein [Weeksellaceae bacterium]